MAKNRRNWTDSELKGAVAAEPPRAKRPLHLLLQRGSAYHSDKLRRRLIAEGVFEARCAACGLTHWRGGRIPLELDHIDGDRENNELHNVRLVCPNCHALTPTYRGRNKRLKRTLRQSDSQPGW